MNGKRRYLWLGLGFLIAFLELYGCKSQGRKGDIVIVLKGQEGEALAEVGGRKLTVAQLREDFLDRQGTFRGAETLNSDKARADYIEDQVMKEAMFQEAIALNYFDRVDVGRDLKELVVQRLVRDKLEEAQKKFVPTKEEIKEHYEKNINLFKREEAVKAIHIAVSFGTDRAKAKEIALSMLKEAKETVRFGNKRAFSRIALAQQARVEGLKDISIKSDETDYLEREGFESLFGKGSFDSVRSLEKTGEIAPLLTTDSAFVILMKTGFRKELNESAEEAEATIIKQLSYGNRGNFYKEFMDGLRKKYDIKVFNEHLAKLSEGAQGDELTKGDEVEP